MLNVQDRILELYLPNAHIDIFVKYVMWQLHILQNAPSKMCRNLYIRACKTIIKIPKGQGSIVRVK